MGDNFFKVMLFISYLCHMLGRPLNFLERWFLHQPVKVLPRFTPPMITEGCAAFLCKDSQKISGGPQWVSPMLSDMYYLPLPDTSQVPPCYCCVDADILELLYPRFHDATIMCHQFTKVSCWPGRVLPLAPLTSLFVISLVHATIIYCPLLVPGTVLGTWDT